jgi:hypothetical protein
MVKGNKGEWSEFYAFLKILTDGKMFTADKNLEILKDNFYIVLKIVREEIDGRKSYDISKRDGKIVISDEIEGGLNDVVEVERIKNRVAGIFEEMKNSKNTTFQILLAEEAMKDLHCSRIKASSGRKADLMAVLHDRKSPIFPELGFSIKSMLGSPSTLLNASGATNFIYNVLECNESDEDIDACNNALVLRDRARYVYDSGGHFKYCGMDSEGFRKNLRKIDSNFPEIISEILKHYYNGKGSKIADLVEYISSDTEFCAKLDFDKSDFVFKVKRFLSDIALGMTPKKEWDGHAKAHGGYIIVKENGEIVCYHIYNRDQFEDYLYNNTKLDTPSTTRHKFGYFFEENGQKKIKYNLQIRFIK